MAGERSGKLTEVVRWRHSQAGTSKSLRREVKEKHQYTRRELEALALMGAIEIRDTESIQKRYISEESGDAPIVWPELRFVLVSWDRLGVPVSRLSGLSAGVLDNRAQLYMARHQYLDAEGFDDPDIRSLVFYLWHSLDDCELRCQAEAVEREKRAAGNPLKKPGRTLRR